MSLKNFNTRAVLINRSTEAEIIYCNILSIKDDVLLLEFHKEEDKNLFVKFEESPVPLPPGTDMSKKWELFSEFGSGIISSSSSKHAPGAPANVLYSIGYLIY